MPNYFLKCMLVFVMITHSITPEEMLQNSNNNIGLMARAKRSFLQRERRYLKKQPLSKELLSFITEYKRNKLKSKGKRSEIDGTKNDNSATNGAKAAKEVFNINDFTISSMSLPYAENSNEKSEDSTFVVVREIQTEKIKPQGDENIYDSVSVTESSEDKQLFNQVVEDVNKLIKFKDEGKLIGREGALCDLNGYWDSEAGGVQLNMTLAGSEDCNRRQAEIFLIDRYPPSEDGFLCDGSWKLSGEMPFGHSTVILVTGFHKENKKVATFIGECRICEGSPTVTGQWMIGRASRDCKDREASHVVVSDIWRKNTVKHLQQDHLKLLNTTISNL